MRNSYIRLFKYALPYIALWITAIFFMIVFTLCSTFSVMGMIPLIDKVLSNKPIQLPLSIKVPFLQNTINSLVKSLNLIEPLMLLKIICIFLLVITVIKGISQFFQQVIMERVSQNISRDLRSDLFDKYFHLPLQFFTGSKTGELVSKITLDVNLIQVIFSGRFTNTVLDSLHFFPFLFIVLLIDWRMTIISTIVLPISIFPIILIGRQIRKITVKTQQNYADIASNIFEILNAIKIIKIFSQKEMEHNKFLKICDKTINNRIKSQKKEAVLSPVTELIGVVTGVFLLWQFSPNVLSGNMSLGVFITYITCIACLIKPIKTFGKIQVMLQNALAGADRIFKVIDLPSADNEISGVKKDIEFKKSIEFKNVTFGYTNDSIILNNISFTINKGEVVALVGSSGSGKTTIANLIPRFFDISSGEILLDGEDIKNIHVSSIRKLLGMVTQEPILFNASIKENIAYGKPNAEMDEIINAAKLARAHEFILNTDCKYDTLVGEKGMRLSGGEKQRITIARALLKNPDLIIFDEATSALDAENEKLVQEAIDRVMENRTVLVIAHRLSTIVKAHKIIVIDNGEIKQIGNHTELIKEEGIYKKLYELNFST